MEAVIIGGGIGGLACALALSQRGWKVRVLERSAEFTEVGAGLSLWPNALRALDALGIGEPVRQRALLEGQAGIRDATGRWLARTGTAELERRYGPTAMIHRAGRAGPARFGLTAEGLRAGPGMLPLPRQMSRGKVKYPRDQDRTAVPGSSRRRRGDPASRCCPWSRVVPDPFVWVLPTPATSTAPASLIPTLSGVAGTTAARSGSWAS